MVLCLVSPFKPKLCVTPDTYPNPVHTPSRKLSDLLCKRKAISGKVFKERLLLAPRTLAGNQKFGITITNWKSAPGLIRLPSI